MKKNNSSETILLERIARYLILHGSFTNNIGLLNGKTGFALFFYEYSQYTGKKLYKEFADELIREIYREINEFTPLNFREGLCGIGWGIEYFLRNRYVEGEPDKVLEEFDKKIVEWDVRRITDFSLEKGLCGIACYYGIGTYINNLVVALKNSGLEFGIIYLGDQGNEVEITEKDGYKQIFIPFPGSGHAKLQEYYHRNVVYLLKELIPYDKNTEYIFHLNFMGNEVLVKNLKKMFRCKIISVVHYTNWSFDLNGDYSKLKKIYATNLKLLSNTDKSIVKNVRNDLKVLNKVDCVICVSKHTLDTYRNLGGLKNKRVEIVNNALQDGYRILTEKEKQNLREKYRIGQQEKIILFAGRLDPIKGINNLLSGFKKILEKDPDTRLFIAGDGNFSDAMQCATGYWSKVSFTGRIDKERLYELYCLADIGVVCSLYEEFGLVAIEMMMHQLPVIVTKTSGLDEIVKDNISGLKVPVRTRKSYRMVDVKILVEKIEYLFDNQCFAERLGDNARKRFLEKYELSLFREKMLNLYSELFQKVNG